MDTPFGMTDIFGLSMTSLPMSAPHPQFFNHCLDRNDSALPPVKRRVDEWLAITSANTDQTYLAHFLHDWHFGTFFHRHHGYSSFCCQHSDSKILYICSINQTVCCCVMFYFVWLILVPSGSCQVDVWSRLMLRAARCIFFLVFPIFKQQQPPLQQPGGMCANSNSPVGSIAITEPLLYPCNCKGSCFLTDQTASQPPGRAASSPLAGPGKWGHFAGELNNNKGCFFW